MEEKYSKYKKIIIITCILLIFIGSGFYYCLTIGGVDRITAMDGKAIADDIANDWHNDSVFVYLATFGINHIRNGPQGYDGYTEAGWYYVYYSPTTRTLVNTEIGYERAAVFIYANYSSTINVTVRAESEIETPVTNVTLDITEAVVIAKNNELIELYLVNYSNGGASYQLKVRDIYPYQATWFIRFRSYGYTDSHFADIYIDADTGEVLHIETGTY